MKTTREMFLEEIEAYLKATGMPPSDFGYATSKNRSLVARIRNGQDVRGATMDRVREWMAKHPTQRPKGRRKVTAIEVAA